MRRAWLLLVLFACGRTELAFERDDAGVDGGLTSCVPIAESAFIARWNDAAQPVPEFTWTQVDDFPHPTFHGGSADAYTKAAGVLSSMLAAQGDACFGTLMDRPWKYGCRTSMCKTVTLRAFAIELCRGPSSSLVSPPTRSTLCTACARWGC